MTETTFSVGNDYKYRLHRRTPTKSAFQLDNAAWWRIMPANETFKIKDVAADPFTLSKLIARIVYPKTKRRMLEFCAVMADRLFEWAGDEEVYIVSSAGSVEVDEEFDRMATDPDHTDPNNEAEMIPEFPIEGTNSIEAKQVIVMRKDLKMGRGKEIAQGSHASIAWLVHRVRDYQNLGEGSIKPVFSGPEESWMNNSFVKITCQVDSQEELEIIAKRAKDAGLICNVIIDSGRTVFKGVPTPTCLAIGPALEDHVNAITGKLKLY